MEEILKKLMGEMSNLSAKSAIELLSKQCESIVNSIIASGMSPLNNEQINAIRGALQTKFEGKTFKFDEILDFVDKAKEAKNPLEVFLPECVNEDGEIDLTSLGLLVAKEVANGAN